MKDEALQFIEVTQSCIANTVDDSIPVQQLWYRNLDIVVTPHYWQDSHARVGSPHPSCLESTFLSGSTIFPLLPFTIPHIGRPGACQWSDIAYQQTRMCFSFEGSAFGVDFVQRIKSAMEYQGFIALWFHANAYRGAFPSSEGYKLTNFLQVFCIAL